MGKSFAILTVFLLAAAPSLAAEPADVLAGACANCHGADGIGSGAIPALKGKPETILVEQLKGFKAGRLPNTVMGRLAKGYSDDQLAELARYFAAK